MEKTIASSSAPDNSYGKKEKLKSKRLITQLFEEGRSISAYPLKLIYLPVALQDQKVKAGVTVSKRNFKSAVQRNRIKRMLREAYRLNKGLVFNNTKGSYAFLFLYLDREMPTFETLDQRMKLLLQKFNLKVDEKTS